MNLMPNTSYDNNTMGGQNNFIDQSDNLSHAASEPAGERRKGAYRKYGIKEYNNMKNQAASSKMGGLGANIGGEKWEIANKKKEIAR